MLEKDQILIVTINVKNNLGRIRIQILNLSAYSNICKTDTKQTGIRTLRQRKVDAKIPRHKKQRKAT